MENTAKKITVQNTVNAPVEKVWKLWSTPADIMVWNTASPDWHTPHAENDLRVGGKFVSTMAARDGSFSFDFGGEYTAVEENKLIAYTMADGRKATVTFITHGDSTDIVTTFDMENENSEEMQRGGWQAIMDNFKAYAEAN